MTTLPSNGEQIIESTCDCCGSTDHDTWSCLDYGRDDEDDRSEFADPGGHSALRAATKSNPRNLPCPTCREPNRLTPKDKVLGYQCDQCADREEFGGF